MVGIPPLLLHVVVWSAYVGLHSHTPLSLSFVSPSLLVNKPILPLLRSASHSFLSCNLQCLLSLPFRRALVALYGVWRREPPCVHELGVTVRRARCRKQFFPYLETSSRNLTGREDGAEVATLITSNETVTGRRVKMRLLEKNGAETCMGAMQNKRDDASEL